MHIVSFTLHLVTDKKGAVGDKLHEHSYMDDEHRLFDLRQYVRFQWRPLNRATAERELGMSENPRSSYIVVFCSLTFTYTPTGSATRSLSLGGVFIAQ